VAAPSPGSRSNAAASHPATINVAVEVRTGPRPDVGTGASADGLAIPSEVWVVLAITAAAAALRFATITSQSYWFDEATTAHDMQLSFGAMLHAVRVGESTPPLYYALAWVWAKLFGTGEAGLRSLSAVIGTAAIPITYLCGRELTSRGAGYVAAALAAVSPWMIWYSQEARAYMLLAALCGVSLLFFAKALRDPSRRNLTWWAVSSSLALLTHYFAGFAVAPEALWLLVRIRTRRVVIAAAAIAAVQAAIVPLVINDLNHHHLNWINQFPLHLRIEDTAAGFAVNTLAQSSAVHYGLLGAGLLAAIAAVLIRFGAPPEQRPGAIVAAGVAASVLLVPLLLAAVGHDYYLSRNLIAAWIPLAVVLGTACAAPRTLPAGIPLLIVLIGAFLYTGIYIDQHPAYQRPDYRGAARALGATALPRAVVTYGGENDAQSISLYLRGAPWSPPPNAPVTIRELDVIGNIFQTSPQRLPFGARLLQRRTVNNFLVERFALPSAWHLTPAGIAARAAALLEPARANPGILVQPAPRGFR
jgi:mannosyltransferase